ncbi:MAG: 2-C-methyl-D-erythritol 4-phosphate cytidylyltransferase [Actinomycetota bacterium]
MNPAAIVVAAGTGTRFGGPKHQQVLAGTPLWKRSVNVFDASGIEEIVVVGDVPGGIPGGRRRQDSVAAGLDALSDRPDWVIVHDAARPLVTEGLVERVLSRAAEGDVDAVIPSVPMTDTVKRVDGEIIVGTVDRDTLVTVQTPQAFRLTALRSAHMASSVDATDDAALVELAGGTVVHVNGDPMNIKITYPQDLVVAEALLSREATDE